VSSTILAFVGLAIVLVAIPGPAVILVLKSAMIRGRRPAIVTACGVLTADLIWATASVVGLTALLVSSQVAFDVVRIAGAAYLIYLGVRLFLARPQNAGGAAGLDVATQLPHRRRSFVEGFLNDLSNPKTVIVYASVIPQFAGPSSTPADLFVLGVVFALLGFISLSAYAIVFGAARGVIRHGRLMRGFLRVSGGLLTAFGIGLLVERPTH